MEQYLFRLNRALLESNAMTVLQMFETQSGPLPEPEAESIGRGKLIWVPSLVQNSPRAELFKPNCWRSCKRFRHRKRLRGVVATLADYWNFLRYRFHCDHSQILALFESFRIDLVVFHSLSYDADVVIRKARQGKIPFAFVNHFDNSRYARPSIRKQIAQASGVGGISGRNVPLPLASKFSNLSDAVDLEFFNPEALACDGVRSSMPVLLLPARVTEGKGHLDMIEVARRLHACGRPVEVVFAGAIEDGVLLAALQARIRELALESAFRFAGQCDLFALRGLYHASQAVVLPSYSEGLGRVLLEGQAMEKPVVAYDTGGVADALQDGKTGFLVPRGDVTSFTARLVILLAEPATAARMGRQGRLFALQNFSMRSLVQRHEEFCLRALRDRGSRHGNSERRDDDP